MDFILSETVEPKPETEISVVEVSEYEKFVEKYYSELPIEAKQILKKKFESYSLPYKYNYLKVAKDLTQILKQLFTEILHFQGKGKTVKGFYVNPKFADADFWDNFGKRTNLKSLDSVGIVEFYRFCFLLVNNNDGLAIVKEFLELKEND